MFWVRFVGACFGCVLCGMFWVRFVGACFVFVVSNKRLVNCCFFILVSVLQCHKYVMVKLVWLVGVGTRYNALPLS
jgi:hypothetical protein